MTSWITVCDTCKRDDPPPMGPPHGETLADLVETAAKAQPAVRVRRFSCLMGCQRACNVTVQAPGKIGYTLAGFHPDATAAEAIVGYAALHAESAGGQVPYRQWPQGVKGHFVSRHPPLSEPS